MSLDTMSLWPFRYTLKCERRADLDESLGTLPNHSLYIGSSNNDLLFFALLPFFREPIPIMVETASTQVGTR